MAKGNGKSKSVKTSTGERQIADIEIDLDNALRADRKNRFVIGALLIEAKDKVAHGEWLPWLQKNFGRSESTAQNYMSAARLLAKNPTIRDLKLTPGAVYWLSREHTDLFEEEVYEQLGADILRAARDQLVNEEFCVDLLFRRVEEAAEAQKKREAEESSKPTPDEPTRQGPHLVSSDGVSISDEQAKKKERVQEQVLELQRDVEEEETQRKQSDKLHRRFRAAVAAVYAFTEYSRADLKGAIAADAVWNRTFERAANFLISFVDTPNKKTRGVVELQRVQIEKQQTEIDRLRGRYDDLLAELELWLDERDKLALLEDGQEAPADEPKWDYGQLREMVEEKKTELEEEEGRV